MPRLLFNHPGLGVLAGSVFDLKFESSELGRELGAFQLSRKSRELADAASEAFTCSQVVIVRVLSCLEKYIWVGHIDV
jgi:hypothetical protein